MGKSAICPAVEPCLCEVKSEFTWARVKRSKCSSSIGKSVGIGVVGRCYVGDDCELCWKGFWKAARPSLKAQKRSSKESVQ